MNLKKIFNFLVEDYSMQYQFQSFEYDLSGNFYGPMDAYSFYSNNGCFTIYHAVQRGEWDYYVSQNFSSIQAGLLEKRLNEKSILKNNKVFFFTTRTRIHKLIAANIKQQINERGEFFGIKVFTNGTDGDGVC